MNIDPLWYWIILIAANLPIYILIGWVFFQSWEGFLESLYYLIKPDLWSWISGEGVDDLWAELRIFVFVFVCGGVIWGEHRLIQSWFGESEPSAAMSLPPSETIALAGKMLLALT